MSIVQISSMHCHVQSNFFSLFAFWFHMQLRLLYRSFCQIVSIEIPTCLANPKKGGSLHDKCLASLRWMWRRPCRNDDSMSVVTMDGALRRLRCTMPVRGLPLSHAKRFNKIGAACPRCRQSIIWLWPLRSLCVVCSASSWRVVHGEVGIACSVRGDDKDIAGNLDGVWGLVGVRSAVCPFEGVF